MAQSRNGRDELSSLPQIDKFRESAREMECDEDEAAFEEHVRRVAKAHLPEGEVKNDPAE